MVVLATSELQPLLDDPDRTAVQKFNGMFQGLASWKTQRRELLLAVLETWLSDDNAIVREKFRREVVATITPILTAIVRQGVHEGTFSVTSPEHAGRVTVSLLLGANEHASALYLANHNGEVPFEVVEGALNAYPEAMERILGAPEGSLRWWPDNRLLHEWFL
jgi:hypothetical protein